MNREQITFEIKEKIGVIMQYPTGWSKELNIISWNGNPPKYDIRDWSPDHEYMSRGVTLTEKEMSKIKELVQNRDMNAKPKAIKERENER